MASTVLNSPCNVGAAKFEYVGLKPEIVRANRNFLSFKSPSISQRKPLIIRASEKHSDSGGGSSQKIGLTDSECEALVVAGKAPEAPPVPPKPAAPSGTLAVSPLVSSLN